jgi:hypothetical protein
MIKRKSALEKKLDLVIFAALSRITDFQMQSMDDEFMDAVEDFREYISNYNYKPGEKNASTSCTDS